MRGRLLGVVLAIVIVAGGASCSEEPEPKFAPPDPTPSAPASTLAPSPSPAPSAKPRTRAGVVRAWVTARNHALATGDTSGMETLTVGDCAGCAYFVRGIKEVYEAGGYYDTDGWKVQETLVLEPDVVDLRVIAAAGETVNAAGEEPVPFTKATRDLRFTVGRVSDRWRIKNIVLLQPS